MFYIDYFYYSTSENNEPSKLVSILVFKMVIRCGLIHLPEVYINGLLTFLSKSILACWEILVHLS